MKVRFKGSSAHRRELTKADFQNVGVEDQGKVVFATRHANLVLNPKRYPPADQEQEVSDAAGKYLVENDDFEEVKEESTPEEESANADSKANTDADADADADSDTAEAELGVDPENAGGRTTDDTPDVPGTSTTRAARGGSSTRRS